MFCWLKSASNFFQIQFFFPATEIRAYFMFGYFQFVSPDQNFKQIYTIMNTSEYHQDMEPGKKSTGVLPFFLIIGGFVAILVLIKLFL
jgi:hypothetical protein